MGEEIFDKEVFIDANVFLEIFFDDFRGNECEKFLKSLEISGITPITSDFLIYSCILAIENKFRDYKKIENALIFFSNYHNLVVLRPSINELLNAVSTAETEKLDFDDSLVVACMQAYGIKELASLDKHFDKIKTIKRINL